MTIYGLDVLLSQFGTSLLFHVQFHVQQQFMSVTSWPAYRFLRWQVRWSGIPISWRIFHSLLWSTWSKALVLSVKKVFFWNSLPFSMIQWMLAIWSPVSLPFINPVCTLNFSVHVMLKPNLKNFEHYLARMWNECNCMVFWIFFFIDFLYYILE